LFSQHQPIVQQLLTSFSIDQNIFEFMPPSRKPKKSQHSYGWVAGAMRGLKHEAFIARGGFGEVHKVKTTCATPLMMQMLNEGTGQVAIEC
jgi:hypothetical protein